MKDCGDPLHRHRTEAAAQKCAAMRLAYRKSFPGDPLYEPHSQSCIEVPQQELRPFTSRPRRRRR